MPLDHHIIGQEFDRTAYTTVTDDEILAYSAAIGEPLPEQDGGPLMAPNTFVLRMHGRKFMPAELLKDLGKNGLDAGKDIEFGVPIRSGDTLTSVSTIHDLYEKTGRSGTMTFVVLRTLVLNQSGEQAAAIDQRMMFK